MNGSWLKAGLAVAGLAVAGPCGPAAVAAQGDTSGPAAGTTTVPSAATQKQASQDSGTAAGAPGVEGKPGGESGAAPAPRNQKGSQP